MVEPPKQTLHVGRPNPGDRKLFQQLLDDMFRSNWYTNGGRLVQQFESKLCELLGVRHCIPICNGTVGLQIACQALGLRGEVIIPAFTFVATAHAVHWEGLRPVFCDVDPETHQIDPACIERLISEKTSAILGVHLWGGACDIESIQTIAEKHGLHTFYDAAHALGVEYRGRMIGNHGRCEVFSFHATKFIHSFEGGAIATNDDELAEKIRLLKNFGFESMDKVVYLGTNGKMPEVCAAMGLSSLSRLEAALNTNRRNYLHYRKVLSEIPGIRMVDFDHLNKTNWQYIVVEVDKTKTGVSRDFLMKVLHTHNIRARRYFYPGCHRMQPYASFFPLSPDDLPVTDNICQKVLILPTGSSITARNINFIGELIKYTIQGNR